MKPSSVEVVAVSVSEAWVRVSVHLFARGQVVGQGLVEGFYQDVALSIH